MKLDVKLLDVDIELLVKRMRIRHGQNEVFTPAKASFREIASTTGINEIYKKVGWLESMSVNQMLLMIGFTADK